MLETIREQDRAMKLQKLIIANFIPEDTAKMLEHRAAWIENEEGDAWIIPVS